MQGCMRVITSAIKMTVFVQCNWVGLEIELHSQYLFCINQQVSWFNTRDRRTQILDLSRSIKILEPLPWLPSFQLFVTRMHFNVNTNAVDSIMTKH